MKYRTEKRGRIVVRGIVVIKSPADPPGMRSEVSKDGGIAGEDRAGQSGQTKNVAACGEDHERCAAADADPSGYFLENVRRFG